MRVAGPLLARKNEDGLIHLHPMRVAGALVARENEGAHVIIMIIIIIIIISFLKRSTRAIKTASSQRFTEIQHRNLAVQI